MGAHRHSHGQALQARALTVTDSYGRAPSGTDRHSRALTVTDSHGQAMTGTDVYSTDRQEEERLASTCTDRHEYI
jgi:hypothetical protein